MPEPSRTLATVGRIVHVYSAAGWKSHKDRPLNIAAPGIVVGAFGSNINVNVFADGANLRQTLSDFRASPNGNTLCSIPLYDALTQEERSLVARSSNHWAEWMPYQVGQAKKTEALGGDDITKRLTYLEEACKHHGIACPRANQSKASPA